MVFIATLNNFSSCLFVYDNSLQHIIYVVVTELCAVCTEMQLLYVLWCHNQLSIQPLFKEVPLSMCFWKWLFSGLSSALGMLNEG